jgi:hypothetical protein
MQYTDNNLKNSVKSPGLESRTPQDTGEESDQVDNQVGTQPAGLRLIPPKYVQKLRDIVGEYDLSEGEGEVDISTLKLLGG